MSQKDDHWRGNWCGFESVVSLTMFIEAVAGGDKSGVRAAEKADSRCRRTTGATTSEYCNIGVSDTVSI